MELVALGLSFIGVVLVITIIGIILRKGVLWYFKIDEHHRKMDRLINLNIRLIEEIRHLKGNESAPRDNNEPEPDGLMNRE